MVAGSHDLGRSGGLGAGQSSVGTREERLKDASNILLVPVPSSSFSDIHRC